jgi:hypothetical protein
MVGSIRIEDVDGCTRNGTNAQTWADILLKDLVNTGFGPHEFVCPYPTSKIAAVLEKPPSTGKAWPLM